MTTVDSVWLSGLTWLTFLDFKTIMIWISPCPVLRVSAVTYLQAGFLLVLYWGSQLWLTCRLGCTVTSWDRYYSQSIGRPQIQWNHYCSTVDNLIDQSIYFKFSVLESNCKLLKQKMLKRQIKLNWMKSYTHLFCKSQHGGIF